MPQIKFTNYAMDRVFTGKVKIKGHGKGKYEIFDKFVLNIHSIGGEAEITIKDSKGKVFATFGRVFFGEGTEVHIEDLIKSLSCSIKDYKDE